MAKQKNAELGFANSKYGEIKKVYSIWICIGHAKQKNDVINSYTIQESCHTKIWHAPRNHFDIMTAVMVYPQVEAFQNGKEDREAQNPVKTCEQKLLELLKVLFIKDFSVEKKKERLEKEKAEKEKAEKERLEKEKAEKEKAEKERLEKEKVEKAEAEKKKAEEEKQKKEQEEKQKEEGTKQIAVLNPQLYVELAGKNYDKVDGGYFTTNNANGEKIIVALRVVSKMMYLIGFREAASNNALYCDQSMTVKFNAQGDIVDFGNRPIMFLPDNGKLNISYVYTGDLSINDYKLDINADYVDQLMKNSKKAFIKSKIFK